MRCLTLTQPWAGLVASGIKLVENRPRRMIKDEDFGKVFAIHASREVVGSVYDRIYEIAPEFRPELATTKESTRWHELSRITSAVIAVANLDDAFYIGGNSEATTDQMFEKKYGPGNAQRRWAFGPVCYLLRDVRALIRPVPCRGWQGFWTLPAVIEVATRTQLVEAA